MAPAEDDARVQPAGASEDDLARDVQTALDWLPAPRAPATLLPRVMAAVHSRDFEPWYGRAWLSWPLAWQMTTAVLLLALVAGAAVLALSAGSLDVAWRAGGDLGARLTEITAGAETAAACMRVLWRLLLGPAVTALFVLAVGMSLASVAVWAALSRIALGGASQS
jgi:hypothetical protein